MCEITFVSSLKDKLSAEEIKKVMSLMDKASDYNSDGYGLFNKDIIYKGTGKFSSKKYSKKINHLFKNSTFIVAHNRLKTSGKVCPEHTHPILTKNLCYVHNGVLWGVKWGKFDSEEIGDKIEKYLAKEKDIVKAIEKGFGDLRGSFSVFLYHKKSKRLFYTRHNAKFRFLLLRKDKDIIVYGNTTNYDNNIYLRPNHKKAYGFNVGDVEIISVKVPKDGVIYEITNKGLEEVGHYESGCCVIPSSVIDYKTCFNY